MDYNKYFSYHEWSENVRRYYENYLEDIINYELSIYRPACLTVYAVPEVVAKLNVTHLTVYKLTQVGVYCADLQANRKGTVIQTTLSLIV